MGEEHKAIIIIIIMFLKLICLGLVCWLATILHVCILRQSLYIRRNYALILWGILYKLGKRSMKDQYRLLIFAPHIVHLNTMASLVKSKTLVKLILQCRCEHSHICFGMCIELWFLNVIPWAGEVARLHPFNANLRQDHAQLKSRFHSSNIIGRRFRSAFSIWMIAQVWRCIMGLWYFSQ